jgi:hypothetical protein
LQGFGVPAESYGFANKPLAWETIAPLLDRASPLRTAHLRDPVGPQDQSTHDAFAQLGLFHQESAQPARRNEEGLDRPPGVSIYQRRVAR